MSIITVATALGSALLGTGLGALLTFKLGNRKQDESEFVSIVNEYKGLMEGYKMEVDSLRKEVVNIQLNLNKTNLSLLASDKEITNLRNQLMIFESANADVPVPIWLKDTQGIMLFVNEEYERSLLQPINKTSEDYIGFTDSNVWSKKIAKQFQAHDKEVMRKKVSVEFTETWEGNNGITFEGRVLKYPRFMGGARKTVIGVGGIILDIKQIQQNKLN